MNTEKFDVVIIGAGLGGLSAAGYLAKAGRKVLVLEHHTVPGGYAHEFRRGKFRFEVALHALDGAAPGGWVYPVLSDLDVLDSVAFTRLDPFYVAKFPDHEIAAHADPYEYEAELICHFPDEAEGIRRLIDSMKTVFGDVRRFTVDGRLNRRPPLAEMPARYPDMLGAMSRSWEDYMGQYISDPQLQAVFSSLLGYYGLPSGRLNAATFILPWVSYHFFGA
ncbi:MAG: NAD(P)/FAD-dependent oxidoreductase, partial [Anaerolineales bacterium]|nr:NAD(P)/FAD-dependent oxidoreductase [Anaerolineales bacterium]